MKYHEHNNQETQVSNTLTQMQHYSQRSHLSHIINTLKEITFQDHKSQKPTIHKQNLRLSQPPNLVSRLVNIPRRLLGTTANTRRSLIITRPTKRRERVNRPLRLRLIPKNIPRRREPSDDISLLRRIRSEHRGPEHTGVRTRPVFFIRRRFEAEESEVRTGSAGDKPVGVDWFGGRVVTVGVD